MAKNVAGRLLHLMVVAVISGGSTAQARDDSAALAACVELHQQPAVVKAVGRDQSHLCKNSKYPAEAWICTQTMMDNGDSFAVSAAHCQEQHPAAVQPRTVNDENCSLESLKGITPESAREEFAAQCLRRSSFKPSPRVAW